MMRLIEKYKNMNPPLPKLIHLARVIVPKTGLRYLFLRKKDSHEFIWTEGLLEGEEQETGISGLKLEDAMREAVRKWRKTPFRMINCGFRYTLPERDEHGINALLHQMIASYSSFNGIYFDEDLGSNCFVNFASLEAKDLWQCLKKQNKL